MEIEDKDIKQKKLCYFFSSNLVIKLMIKFSSNV